MKFIDDPSEIISFRVKPNYALLGQKYGTEIKKITTVLNELNAMDVAEKVKYKIPVQINSEGTLFELMPEEIIVEELPLDNYSVISNRNFTIGIDTKLTESLIREGMVRDIVRQVQNLRKESGFRVEDRIHIKIDGSDEIHAAIENNRTYFLNEVLARTLNNISCLFGLEDLDCKV